MIGKVTMSRRRTTKGFVRVRSSSRVSVMTRADCYVYRFKTKIPCRTRAGQSIVLSLTITVLDSETPTRSHRGWLRPPVTASRSVRPDLAERVRIGMEGARVRLTTSITCPVEELTVQR